MTDRKREELGSAPTTPAPAGSPAAPELAVGSTLDMPLADPRAAINDPMPGTAIGRFVVHHRLGAGGMGVVFAGADADLGRPVAIKLVRHKDEHPAYRERLLREAQAMARLEHPNVVKVYEVGTDHGRLFVAMELVDGETLTAWLRDRRDWRAVVAMFVAIGDGLAAVHRAGLVHRDFKPDNVLVDHEGRARVADFGLARLDTAQKSPLTQTGVMMGTPGYMAPEQMGGGDVDARADQYSFCVALREALGGRPLDDARWKAVPRALREIVSRGLAYDPDERYPSLDALLVELRRAGTHEARWPLALVALGVLGTVAGIVAYVTSHGRVEPVRDAAVVTVVAPQPDAAGVVLEPPPDAAVAVVARDAGVRHARDAAVRVAAKLDDTSLHVVTPTTKHLPVAKVDDPGHLAIVRAAIRDLGYEGLDLAALDRAPADMQRTLEAEVATATGTDLGIAQVKLGMALRRRGDCTGAKELFRTAGSVLPMDSPDLALWDARGSFGFALCELASGGADDAYHVIMKATLHGNQDEVHLAMGMIAYEIGEKDQAYAWLLRSNRVANPRVQTALHAWLDGLGLGLGE